MKLYNEATTEAAMCAWEWVLDQNDLAGFDIDGGAVSARMTVLNMGHHLDACYQLTQSNEIEVDSFDWEFIPRLMSWIVENEHQADFGAEHYESFIKETYQKITTIHVHYSHVTDKDGSSEYTEGPDLADQIDVWVGTRSKEGEPWETHEEYTSNLRDGFDAESWADDLVASLTVQYHNATVDRY